MESDSFVLRTTAVADGLNTIHAYDRCSLELLSSANQFFIAAIGDTPLRIRAFGGLFLVDKNYCVIDYGNTSNLRWTVTGNPTSCTWVTPPSDTSGTASGNSLPLTNLLNKLEFQYQLECR